VRLSERTPKQEFLSLEAAHASVALLPLLRGEVIVDRVRVSGLRAQIVKGKDGRFNFQDLIEREGQKPAPKPAPTAEEAAPVRFDIAGISIERAALAYRDLASGEELAISDLRLETGRIAEGAQGKVEFSTAVSRKAPPLAMQLALNGSYALRPEAVALDFHARLDDSHAKGRLGIARAEKTPHTFDIQLDRIDLDRYLPPEPAPGGKLEQKAQKPQKPAEDTPIDLSGLRDLHASGQLQVGSLKVRGLGISDLKTGLKAAAGRVEVGPHTANLYEGALSGTAILDANANRIALKENLKGIAIGPLLRDVAEQDRLEGRGNLAIDVAAAGGSVNAMKSALGGTARVELRDGAIKGIDIGAALRRARTLLGSQQSPAAEAREQTEFSELSASFQIKNGVARNDDLDVKAPLFRLTGAGSIDIAKSTIDYVAKASVVATTEGQAGRERDQLAGLTLPVRLTGPLDAMKYEVDYRAVVQDVGKTRVGERVQEEVEQRREKLEDQVRDRLKGLLRR
jgi:AsmA protein